MNLRSVLYIRDHALQQRFSSLQTILRFSLTAILHVDFAHSGPHGDGLPGTIYAHDIKGSTLPNLANPSGLNFVWPPVSSLLIGF
jgi:hypothetical protein